MHKMVILFVIHLFGSFYLCYLALEYVSFVPETAGGAIFSFLGSFTLCWLLSGLFARRYFLLIIQIMRLAMYFLKELVRSNLKLINEIITPSIHLHPAIVKVPLRISSDTGIMVLANIANLTPGTLILGVSEDKKYMFVHTIYLEGGSVEAFKKYISDGFEERILAIAALTRDVSKPLEERKDGGNETNKSERR